jgi:hypothetical protein
MFGKAKCLFKLNKIVIKNGKQRKYQKLEKKTKNLSCYQEVPVGIIVDVRL